MILLPEDELQNRIFIIERQYEQPTYAGPNQNVDVFLATIENNCIEVDVPPRQRVDVALYFMSAKIRAIMSKYKENIQKTEKPNGDTLWDIFKSVFKELHVKATESMNGGSSNPESDPFIEAAAGGAVVAGITYAVAPPIIIAALNAVGFTSSGVLAGSLAAAAQSAIYGGSTGGIFAAMQSIGATGVVASAPVLALGIGLAFAGYHLVRHVSARRQQD